MTERVSYGIMVWKKDKEVILMKENAWLTYTDEDINELEILSDQYKEFLTKCKTERECTAFFKEEAEKAGYRNLEELIE